MNTKSTQLAITPEAPVFADSEQLLSIKNLCKLSGLGRTLINEELRSGRLKSIKVRKRRLIRRGDYVDWLQYYAGR